MLCLAWIAQRYMNLNQILTYMIWSRNKKIMCVMISDRLWRKPAWVFTYAISVFSIDGLGEFGEFMFHELFPAITPNSGFFPEPHWDFHLSDPLDRPLALHTRRHVAKSKLFSKAKKNNFRSTFK